ncbi:hypothetical protein ACQCSU_14665 [Pseudarthrobacter sp. O4]|uniref:hypothetical protein n=1 Tax=Pseudarthrobacter sp. O4 TaxID=3418417 RepID=UPI003CF4DDE2
MNDVEGQGQPERTRHLVEAMESFGRQVSPQLARSVQATVNLKIRIREDYGLLSDADVHRMLGLPGGAELPDLLALVYQGNVVFPGFQFERARGAGELSTVRPFLVQVRALAREVGCDDLDMITALTSPTTHLGEGRTLVDCLDDTDTDILLAKLRSSLTLEW